MSEADKVQLYFHLVEALGEVLLGNAPVEDPEVYAGELLAAIALLRKQSSIL